MTPGNDNGRFKELSDFRKATLIVTTALMEAGTIEDTVKRRDLIHEALNLYGAELVLDYAKMVARTPEEKGIDCGTMVDVTVEDGPLWRRETRSTFMAKCIEYLNWGATVQ